MHWCIHFYSDFLYEPRQNNTQVFKILSWIQEWFNRKRFHFWNGLRKFNKERIRNHLFFFVLVNILWIIFRTGSKPSRITYPCQKAAVNNISLSISTLVPLSISTPFIPKKWKISPKSVIVILTILITGVSCGELLLRSTLPNPSQDLFLNIESKSAIDSPTSEIFVVNNLQTPNMSELLDLMSQKELFFYQSAFRDEHQAPSGLLARDDIVLLKINSQWTERGGTNTDLLKDVIETIIDHPEGFTGEIVVADNGQGRGGMDHTENNAKDKSQSTQDVIDSFSSMVNISTFDWSNIRHNRVDEFSEGDLEDGYIFYEIKDPETGIQVSYPKFTTYYGTHISFKHGLWNGTSYEKRMKVINLPVLKSHFIYGVTAAIKNYMGVQSEKLNGGLANGHASVATGGMGTLMVECGLPTLNIIDAIWINANPYPDDYCGPSTEYHMATRVNMLIAGTDPVALDYWAAKNVLLPTANSIGYTNTQSLDPENTQKGGLNEAFGVWLQLTRDELVRGNLSVTLDESQIAITTSSFSSETTKAQISGYEWTVLPLLTLFVVVRKKFRHDSLSRSHQT